MSTYTYNCTSVRMASIPTTAGKMFIPIYKVSGIFPEVSDYDHYTFYFSNLSIKASIMASSEASVNQATITHNLVHEFTRFYTSKKIIGLNSAKEFHAWSYNQTTFFAPLQQHGSGMAYPYYLVPFILIEDNAGKGFALIGVYLVDRTSTTPGEAGRDWYVQGEGYPFEDPTPTKLGYAILKMGSTSTKSIYAVGETPSFRYQADMANSSPTTSRNYFNKIIDYINNGAYDGIDSAETGGNTGIYDFTSSDDIDFPTLPTLSAINTGFVSLWSPTNEQMLNLSRYMWNADILTADFWKKLIANPMELIFGLNIIPVDLRAQESYYVGTPHNVVVGLRDTQIEMDTVTSQWIEYDCGYIDIDETWGAYLDYDPYTKLDIYLPFCGVHPIRTDDFMPGRIHVKYHIDLLSGSCVAIIKSTKTDEHGDVLNSVVYQFMGNCATQVPVTSSQYADAVRSAISIAASVGTMVAGGIGTVAGAAAKAANQTLTNTGLVQNSMHIASDVINTGASIGENVMNLKPSIERSGAIGSSAALLSVQVPYLILTRPRQAKPDSQQMYTGYPSFITEDLVDLKGWTEVQAIHLEGIPCTANELSEINELLKSGVIF